MIKNNKQLLFVFLFSSVYFFSTPAFFKSAYAQTLQERVLQPPAGLSSQGDPFLMSMNPALMALNKSWEGIFYHTELKTQEFIAGTGDAFYISSPPLWIFYLGFGFENTRPNDDWKVRWLQSQGKQTGNWSMLTFALAAKLGEVASLGVNIRTFVADENETFHGLTSCDTGLHLHPSPYFSLSAEVIDINTPRIGSLEGSIERTWGVGVALRPFGKNILTISIDNLLAQTSENDVIRTYFELRPMRGLVLQALLEMWIGKEGFMDDRTDVALQASFGLQFEFPYFGVFGTAHIANRVGSPYLGFTAGARISGQYYLSMMIPRRIVKLKLEGNLDGEEAVDLLLYINSIRKEPSINGVLFEVKDFDAMPGLVQEIISGMEQLKSSGKYVFCYESGLGTPASAYACSHATAYYLSPVGGTTLAGTQMRIFYYTGLLEKLGINAQILRIGEYKSMPESFTREAPSEKVSEEYRELVSDVYNNMLYDIGKGRGFKNGSDGLKELISGGPYNSMEMVEKKLADGVLWEDQLKKAIEDKIGKKVVISEKFDFSTKAPDTWTKGRRIGVIVVSGIMTGGKSRKIPLIGLEKSGSDTVIEAIEKAKYDPTISAVVLRIDSGGGSAEAAERIWRAIRKLSEKKPVIASLGAVAASGGYYIASAADEIFAEPSTITGSIGIFMGKADFSELMKKVGINVTAFKEGSDKVDMSSFYRPFTTEEIEKLKGEINYVYNIFLDRVAEGRKMDKNSVDTIARGRIWSGARAREIGLVDKMGSFLDAVERARKISKLPGWAPVESLTRKEEGFLMKVISSAIDDKSEILKVFQEMGNASSVGGISMYLGQISFALTSKEPLAMIDFVYKWE